ncbi:hypothetical protein EJ04DRAFT_522506 [Polyplosphaeria fusca]|uniref:Uncharacterized protein n=1 Tax=Polyplosphaeria fusca TaxID=682080 RepID=A0A9P4V3Z7_9PLEO|nr:hypothetical protein EJ04DRAFT_522506 [Polyplosphaeria fusca]
MPWARGLAARMCMGQGSPAGRQAGRETRGAQAQRSRGRSAPPSAPQCPPYCMCGMPRMTTDDKRGARQPVDLASGLETRQPARRSVPAAARVARSVASHPKRSVPVPLCARSVVRGGYCSLVITVLLDLLLVLGCGHSLRVLRLLPLALCRRCAFLSPPPHRTLAHPPKHRTASTLHIAAHAWLLPHCAEPLITTSGISRPVCNLSTLQRRCCALVHRRDGRRRV